MNLLFVWMAATVMLVIAGFHSLAGHRRLIGPLLAERTGMLAEPMPRAMILFGWHVGTVLMALPTAYLVLMAIGWTEPSTAFVTLIGLAFLAMGLANAVMTRLRHPGWALLSLAGILTIFSLIF